MCTYCKTSIWKVIGKLGLYSISYSNTWYTLRNHQNHIYCSTDGHSFTYSATVDYGYYASMPDLIKSINAGIKKEFGNTKISFSFNPRTEKVSVTLAPKYGIGLYGQLSKILSLSRKRLPTSSTFQLRRKASRT